MHCQMVERPWLIECLSCAGELQSMMVRAGNKSSWNAANDQGGRRMNGKVSSTVAGTSELLVELLNGWQVVWNTQVHWS